MRRDALQVLACPRCGADLALTAEREDGDRVIEGALRCTGCGARHRIERAVPRLAVGEGHDVTRENFSQQWTLRLDGRFEEQGTLFGDDPDHLVDWLLARMDGVPAGGWLLDAGCGSGEKTIAAARRAPEARVLGIDLSDALDRAAAMARDVPNVDFVQADLLHPPLKAGSMARLVSWGVLHHTRDTRLAFRQVMRALGPAGRAIVWLYPHPDEDELWARYYRIRDRHFLGVGHRLPPRLRLGLAQAYCVVMAPWLLWQGARRVLPRVKDIPYVKAHRQGPVDMWRSAVFFLHDAIAPEFQHRHRRAEVASWFEAAGFGAVESDGEGHFWAARDRVT